MSFASREAKEAKKGNNLASLSLEIIVVFLSSLFIAGVHWIRRLVQHIQHGIIIYYIVFLYMIPTLATPRELYAF